MQVAAECRELLGPHTDTYFQASVFLRLARDESGCAPLPALFHNLGARSRQLQLVRWQLAACCCGTQGRPAAEGKHQPPAVSWWQAPVPVHVCWEA